jgi:hypothetical protein
VLSAHGVADEAFRDVTQESGIRFQLEVGYAAGKKHLFETMVGGAAWLDYDGDGLLDLFIVQGHSNSDRAGRPGAETDVLYRNRGDGTFEDVTARAGVGDPRYGCGAATGDIDNDGDVDLYVTNFGSNTLYRNNGDGTFSDVTESAGVGCPLWSMSAAFADLDGDGKLDLYVGNYLLYRTDIHGACSGNKLKLPTYCHPNRFEGAPDVLYRGLGDGRFEDVTAKAGVGVAGLFQGKSLGVLPTDFDADGDVDLVVPCDSVPSILWRNLGGLRFEDAALETGTALSADGKALAGMGIDGGDFNGDGIFDFTVTYFSKESFGLFIGAPGGYFNEEGPARGVAAPTFLPLGFGCKALDYDLDGDRDLYYACGHVTDVIETLNPGGGELFAQSDLLLENTGGGKFRDVSARSGPWFQRRLVGRGLAAGDYDNDGRVDLFVVNMNGPGVLLRNVQTPKGRWIGLVLRGDGRKVARDAYGAKVTVVSRAGVRRAFEVRSAASYLSANDARVVCGLGEEDKVTSVEVLWPDGARESFTGVEVGRYQEIAYGKGKRP